MFGLGGAGAIALSLVKFKGTWAVARGSLGFSGGLGSRGGYLEVNEFVAARTNRYSCQSHKIEPPPPTAAEQAAQREAARKAAEAKKAEAEQEREDAVQEAADQERDEAAARVEATRQQHEALFRFKGSQQEFRPALVSNLARRGNELGFDPGGFGPELDAIDRMVTTCLTLTFRDWRDAEAEYRADRDVPIKGHDPMARRAKAIKRCDGVGGQALETRISDPGKDPSLSISARMAAMWEAAASSSFCLPASVRTA